MSQTEANSQAASYKQAGVDIEEGARAVDAIKTSVRSTYRPEVVGDIGGFGGMFSIAAAKDMTDPILVSGTDGVGTKLALAQRLDMHDAVGIDLVAMCVNDILALGAEPLFFLDYMAVGKLDSQATARIVAGIAEGCKQAGCSLIGGEMAEHPGVMDPDDYDLSGFCVGLVDKACALDPSRVQEGDVLIGLASSGIHSNGFSLVRHALTNNLSCEDMRKPLPELREVSLADALMAPTKIYVSEVLGLLKCFPKGLRALAHITGGGITENLNRALPKHLDAQIKLGSWECVPICSYVARMAGLSEAEALTTLNMGLGMILIVEASKACAMQEYLDGLGVINWLVGQIVPGQGEVSYINQGALLDEQA